MSGRPIKRTLRGGLLGLRPELARVGGQDCDGPWVQQAPYWVTAHPVS